MPTLFEAQLGSTPHDAKPGIPEKAPTRREEPDVFPLVPLPEPIPVTPDPVPVPATPVTVPESVPAAPR